MEDNGINNVFCVYDPDLKTEVYLLGDSGTAEDGKIFMWVQNITITGVGYRTRYCLPICNFYFDNITWRRKALLESITLEIWDTIKKDLGYNATGPKVFCAIIQKQQLVNSSDVCTLVQASQKRILRKNLENTLKTLTKIWPKWPVGSYEQYPLLLTCPPWSPLSS